MTASSSASSTPAPRKLKAADRHEILNRVLAVLKKKYRGQPPRSSRPLLETMIYAVLLEESVFPQAEAAYDRLLKAFYDLNEIRVSAVGEIEEPLEGLSHPGWRSLRIREILQFTFEKYFAFDLEPLRRKTHDLAEKSLDKIKHLTPFVRAYALLHGLGAHSVPLDTASLEALIWLGLIPPGHAATAGDELKAIVRKSELPQFCYLLHSFANDPAFRPAFKLKPSERHGAGPDPLTAVERLTALIAAGGVKAPAAKTVKKPEAAAKPARAVRKPEGREVRKVAKAKPGRPAPKPVAKSGKGAKPAKKK